MHKILTQECIWVVLQTLETTAESEFKDGIGVSSQTPQTMLDLENRNSQNSLEPESRKQSNCSNASDWSWPTEPENTRTGNRDKDDNLI